MKTCPSPPDRGLAEHVVSRWLRVVERCLELAGLAVEQIRSSARVDSQTQPSDRLGHENVAIDHVNDIAKPRARLGIGRGDLEEQIARRGGADSRNRKSGCCQ